MRFVRFTTVLNEGQIFVNPAAVRYVGPGDDGKTSALYFDQSHMVAVKGTPLEALNQIDGALRG